MLRFACALVVFSAASAHADRAVELGGYAGYTTAKTRTTDDRGYSEPHYSEPGVAIGASLRHELRHGVLIVADLSYTQKGEYGGPNGTHRTYHYLEAPLRVQLDAGRASSSPIRLFIYAGLAPAVRVACTVNGPIFDNDLHMAVHYSGSCASLPVPLNVQPNVFDLGLVVGVGGGWKFRFATIEVEARATQGLVDIEGDGGSKTINRVFSVLVGVSREL